MMNRIEADEAVNQPHHQNNSKQRNFIFSSPRDSNCMPKIQPELLL